MNFNRKEKPLVRMDLETKKKLSELSLELSNIEKDKISMGEVVKRTFRDDNIIQRLKQGSLERRFGVKK